MVLRRLHHRNWICDRRLVGIGVVSFAAPYLGCMLYARYALGWPWPQAQIGVMGKDDFRLLLKTVRIAADVADKTGKDFELHIDTHTC